MNRLLCSLLWLLVVGSQAQDMFFTVSFDCEGTTFRFPSYWRDCALVQSGGQCRTSSLFADQSSQAELIKAFETTVDQARWPSTMLAAVSQCYWIQGDPIKAERAFDIINADSPDSNRPEANAWMAFLFAARGVHHQWILESLSLANESSPCLDYDWCLFWECCRTRDFENGRKHFNSLFSNLEKLSQEERLLMLWFAIQAEDRNLVLSLIENSCPAGVRVGDGNNEFGHVPRIVLALVDLCCHEFHLSEEIWRHNLVCFVSGTTKWSIEPENESIVPPRCKTDVESGSFELNQDNVFHNLIHLSLPYAPPPPNDGWSLFDSNRIVYSLFDCPSAMSALIQSYESKHSNLDSGSVELLLLGYLATGEYEKANLLFPVLVSQKPTNETNELLFLLQVESLLIVPSSVESGMRLALEYKKTCKNPRFRFLALWASLAIEDFDTAKSLLDEYFETGSSDPWFHYAIPAALTFAVKCPDEKKGRVVFELALEVGTKLAAKGDENALQRTKLFSDLGRSAVRKFESSGLPRDVLDDPECFASDATVQFVEDNRRSVR